MGFRSPANRPKRTSSPNRTGRFEVVRHRGEEVVELAGPGVWQGDQVLESPGRRAFGHGGAFGTQGWIDPKKDMVGVFLIQRSGGGDNSESKAFMNMAASAITD